MTDPTPIEDYALIGDTETAALVSRNGSIDWLCLPRFDSPASLAALLGGPGHGRWLLGPATAATTTRSYLGDTTVVETIHTTATGSVRILDFMPFGDGRSDLIRLVEGVSGQVELIHEWTVRPGYGAIVPWVSRRRDDSGVEVLAAVAGPDRFTLRGPRIPVAMGNSHHDRFTVDAGEELRFSLTWTPSWRPLPPDIDADRELVRTIEFFTDWAGRVDYDGPYRTELVRSLLVLRQLTDSDRGGIVAAPTTSLPEEFGGVRNWDYRYTWLRDAALTVRALLRSGHAGSSRLWRDWLVRAVAGDPEDVQIMYAVDGARDLPERELGHLPGYADSRPVRIGNGAVTQQQGDVIGEVMLALGEARDAGLAESPDSWNVQLVLLEHLARTWDEPDSGLWESRGPTHHYTQSGVMAWVAFDQAVRAVEEHGLDGPVERWRELRDTIKRAVLERGFNAEANTFTQHDDTTEVDAALLMIPIVGFLPGDDSRMLGTLAAIERDLLRDGLVLRYRTEAVADGVAGDENPFVACGFWLASAYALAGRLDDAHAHLQRMLALLNDVDLISEEYDPTHHRMAGNFPQALSHLALVGAIYDLADAESQPLPA
ncbi:MAG TPA: glycoside hydrolase family 15 protein [Propionicimonas sp.]|nr:glycoside hydrolase family 15 protein [Propionicimonas sp.]